MVERNTKLARLRNDSHKWLTKESKRTGIPISKLIDMAVDLLKQQRK